MTGMAACASRDLVSQWLTGLRINHLAHIRASAYYAQLTQILGLLSSLLATVVASNTWSTIANLAEKDIRLQIVVGVLSIAVPILTAASAFLKPSELAEKHRSASVGYGELRRELELVFQYKSGDPTAIETCMESIKVRWSDLDKKAPLLSDSMWDDIAAQLKDNDSAFVASAGGTAK